MRIAHAIAALAVTWSASEAAAFECTQGNTNEFVSIFWPVRKIPVAFRAGGSTSPRPIDLERIYRESFDAWTGNECTDIEFDFQTTVANDPAFDSVDCDARRESKATFDQQIGLDRVSQVVLTHSSTCWEQNHPPEALAVTTMTFGTRDGVIRYGLIEINERFSEEEGRGFSFVDMADPNTTCIDGLDYDLGSVLTHEIGHFLGLNHTAKQSADPPTMTANVDTCDDRFRTIAIDDLDGLCYLYPRGQEARQCLPLPEQEHYIASVPFGCQAGPGQGGTWALLTLIAALTCSKARSRR